VKLSYQLEKAINNMAERFEFQVSTPFKKNDQK